MEVFEKSSTVDPEVRAYISSLVNAVGGSSTDDSSYQIGDDAVAVLKDLQRWLRLYDEKTNRLDVKRCLAEANLVRGDLLEILATWREEEQDGNKLKAKLALACLELLVPLTWPLVLEDETATVNHHRHVPYLQLAQVGYKRAVLQFEDAPILRTAVRVAIPAMATPRRERSKRDEGIIKLMLYFFRNLAMITQPQHLPSQGDENEVSRSTTIDTFHQQDIFSVLLTVGSSMGEEFQEQDVILLEILFHLLKGVDARKLFMKKEQVNSEETTELQMLMQKEKAMLNSYKKHAPTRHNRFGTMIWLRRDDMKNSTVSGQASITNEATTLHQMDASKKWNKPQYRGKLAQEFDENSEFGMRTELTDTARNHLRHFVEDFLDSSFNPLFVSLRKAMEREADRVQDMHRKQYFYLISWFLAAEAARRDQSTRDSTWNADRPTQTNPEDNTFAYIAAVLDQETFVLLNRQMQAALDNKSWQDLQATLLAFTRILLTVQSMAESKDEEDQEIAENIQNRIFYEEATHDRIVQILRGYTHQGFAYLDAITECVHVFVRMLERYSKQNADLQIRSKRRARKKTAKSAKTTVGDDAEDAADQAAEDERDAHRAVSERKFDFARFSAKFLSQQCVNAFIALTHYHRDLTPVQMKRAHRFFYRLAFKHELTVLLFRVDILQLFHKMIKGPEGLDPHMEGFKEWEQLVQQVFRRCIKWIERPSDGQGWREAAVVEMLFSKIPATMFYLQNGYERVVEKRAPRPPAELEIKASVPEQQRLAVAVSMLIEQAKVGEVSWVKDQLKNALQERRAWQDEQNARDMGVDETANLPESLPAPSIFINPDNEERKLALFKDKHLRLLLTTLGFQRLGLAEDSDAQWIIPSDLSAEKIEEALGRIQAAEFHPPTFDDDKTAADLIKNKSSTRPAFLDDDDESEGSGGVDDAMFPPNLKEKRKAPADDGSEFPQKKRRRRRRKNSDAGEQLTEAEVEARRRAREKKEREKNSRIKSRLYVTRSDDESDAEGDAEFFRLEAERGKRTAGEIRRAVAGLVAGDGGKKKKKTKKW
ncbi:related to Topoisomerase 1-associated factor 1 [Ramularia collo-cygni]|uniref:Topoisomerase 1-associated factor 1 n=1 Tax=Ramularia collo-cygni TaxID=112498 RepID=A0A2D3V1F3_9PEZI|nr:related to Topoisomerase 1-associated factor 1 [Ramularia collo-cygni]CZT16294.1 related to Topoisomerase 1-associated factor 1 [Ramularia collo-cygni]